MGLRIILSAWESVNPPRNQVLRGKSVRRNDGRRTSTDHGARTAPYQPKIGKGSWRPRRTAADWSLPSQPEIIVA